jgi:hypothetical protein
VVEWITQEVVPGASVSNAVGGLVEFQLPRMAATAESGGGGEGGRGRRVEADVARVFELMQSTSRLHGVEDWSLSQSSLEQVFLKLVQAREAPPNEGDTVTPATASRWCCK